MTYNLCTMFGFRRKAVLKEIHYLIKLGYGSFNDLTSLTLQDINEIGIVLESIKQEETLKNAGM